MEQKEEGKEEEKKRRKTLVVYSPTFFLSQESQLHSCIEEVGLIFQTQSENINIKIDRDILRGGGSK